MTFRASRGAWDPGAHRGRRLEHGRHDPRTNVTDDDEAITGKIAWAHLNEFPDYYTRLAEMEAEAERHWSGLDLAG